MKKLAGDDSESGSGRRTGGDGSGRRGSGRVGSGRRGIRGAGSGRLKSAGGSGLSTPAVVPVHAPHAVYRGTNGASPEQAGGSRSPSRLSSTPAALRPPRSPNAFASTRVSDVAEENEASGRASGRRAPSGGAPSGAKREGPRSDLGQGAMRVESLGGRDVGE